MSPAQACLAANSQGRQSREKRQGRGRHHRSRSPGRAPPSRKWRARESGPRKAGGGSAQAPLLRGSSAAPPLTGRAAGLRGLARGLSGRRLRGPRPPWRPGEVGRGAAACAGRVGGRPWWPVPREPGAVLLPGSWGRRAGKEGEVGRSVAAPPAPVLACCFRPGREPRVPPRWSCSVRDGFLRRVCGAFHTRCPLRLLCGLPAPERQPRRGGRAGSGQGSGSGSRPGCPFSGR